MNQARRRTSQLKTISLVRAIQERQARQQVTDAALANDAAQVAERRAGEQADQAHAGWCAAVGSRTFDLDVCRQWAAAWRLENDRLTDAIHQASATAEALAEDRRSWLGAVRREEVAVEARKHAERRLRLKAEEARLTELSDRAAQRSLAR